MQTTKAAMQTTKAAMQTTKAAMQRPTLLTVLGRIVPFIGRPISCPKTADKGGPGQLLERLTRIPRSSACLDCSDGEVKTFPLKPGTKEPKETCAITMIQPDTIVTTPFEHSNVYKKLANTLFVPYERLEDSITFHMPIMFRAEEEPELAADYEAIQASYAVGEPSSAIGRHLQARTKGPGHGSTSRAFYLRTSFLKVLLTRPPPDLTDVPIIIRRRKITPQ